MGGFILLIVAIVIYFIPAIVALNNAHRNAGAIFLLNLLLGWTAIGWVAAIVWAVSNPPEVIVAAPATAIPAVAPAAIPAAPPAEANLGDQIERLIRMRDSGALTDAEFQAAKGKLLA